MGVYGDLLGLQRGCVLRLLPCPRLLSFPRNCALDAVFALRYCYWRYCYCVVSWWEVCFVYFAVCGPECMLINEGNEAFFFNNLAVLGKCVDSYCRSETGF